MSSPLGPNEIRWWDGTIINLGGKYRARKIKNEWFIVGNNRMIPVGTHENSETDAIQKAEEMNSPTPKGQLQIEPELHLSSIDASRAPNNEIVLSIKCSSKKDGAVEQLIKVIASKAIANELRIQLEESLREKRK